MEPISENLRYQPRPDQNEQQQSMLRACTLYSMNDMLYKDGLITMEKKQQVAQEIWKKYHI